jgi:hypothetical protein
MPMDILQFSRVSPMVPHESTVNQFFTESQFESYRTLGEFEAETIIGDCTADISELFERASRYIDPPPPAKPAAAAAAQAVPPAAAAGGL